MSMTAEELALHREAAAAHDVLASLWRKRWRAVELRAADPRSRRWAASVRSIDGRMRDAEGRLAEVHRRLCGCGERATG